MDENTPVNNEPTNEDNISSNDVDNSAPIEDTPQATTTPDVDPMDNRLERLGGEPAPVITPEEFARLQKAGQVHIDARGRVRTSRRSDADAGVSLRKRRAWYGK